MFYVYDISKVAEEDEEEDLVDPKEEVTEQCMEVPKCVKLKEVMDECSDRVDSKSKTTETCTQELFDFMHCVDHCVSGVTHRPIWDRLLQQSHTQTYL